MHSIVQKENAILRQLAATVPTKDITSTRIQSIIKAMRESLDEQPDGVAIAAPQIGESLRIFVVSKRIHEFEHSVKPMEANVPKDELTPEESNEDIVFINPRMLRMSRDKKLMEEGCLSVRWLYGKVKRSIKATVEAYDEHGKKFTRGASGLLAQVFQHEIDHLDGKLFIDKAIDVREMKPEHNDA